MTNFQKGVIALIKSALLGTKETLPQDFDWQAAIAIGKKHQITPILYYGTINSKVALDGETKAFFENYTMQNIVVNQNQMYLLKVLFAAFEKEGISYMPLKGTVLKKIYPKPEMRTMSDADVLIREEEYSKIKPVLQRLGYTEKCESDHEYIWKKGVLTLELHKSIMPTYYKDYYKYFGNGWKLAKEKFDNYGYKMRAEDELIYNFTHLSKHYRGGGIGIKHVTDVFVCFPMDKALDTDYIEMELKNLHLWEFYTNISETVKVWFEGEEPTEKTDYITDYIFSSGSYGTAETRNIGEAVTFSKMAGGAEKLHSYKRIHLIFPTYKVMTYRNPILKKCPLLLPFMWVWRWFELAFFKRDRVKRKNEKLQQITVEKINSFEDSLKYVGLEYNFEE